MPSLPDNQLAFLKRKSLSALKARCQFEGSGATPEELVKKINLAHFRELDRDFVEATLKDSSSAYQGDLGMWHFDPEMERMEDVKREWLEILLDSHVAVEKDQLINRLQPLCEQPDSSSPARQSLFEDSRFLSSGQHISPAVRSRLPELGFKSAFSGEQPFDPFEFDGGDTAQLRKTIIKRVLDPDFLYQIIEFKTSAGDFPLSIVPAELNDEYQLAAWTGEVPAPLAEHLQLLGWWLWPRGQNRPFANPELLVSDPSHEPTETYVAFVGSKDFRSVAGLVSLTIEYLSMAQGIGSIKYSKYKAEADDRSVHRRFRSFVESSAQQERPTRPVLAKCVACAADLTDPKSAKRGYGPDCYQHAQDKERARNALNLDHLQRLEGESFWDTYFSESDVARWIDSGMVTYKLSGHLY